MENKWREYYSEIFNTYTIRFFVELWGNSVDEYGVEFEEIYKNELEDMRKEFVDFMFLFNKYDMEYNRDVISIKFLDMFNRLNSFNNIEGAYAIADEIIEGIDCMCGFGYAWHPLGSPFSKLA